ncbi:MLO-like protein 13 [Hibiscus syriacus]|uniref:MLO-like protein n=1 Tax=Hibiscus syriacus TaxID=106335 RepID=A0A6A2XEK2_HIBSY|nr:MLO-like protein 13 [Hibiscus syriacus]KAE8656899.1 MLO-like protein 13 [Hibiscus syriacus]
MAAAEEPSSLQYTPTWIVAVVCFLIVLISLIAERGLHHLGKFLKHKNQDALNEALQKLKEELMLLGFISLLLTVFQGLISKMCVPDSFVSTVLLPCKPPSEGRPHKEYSLHAINNRRRLFSTETTLEHCSKGKVPLLSLEALHQLHIFIFVLAVVHVIYCVITMVLGGARIKQWKQWEDWIHENRSEDTLQRHSFMTQHAKGGWKKTHMVTWIRSFFKQFYNSVTKSEYIALREGFIMAHIPSDPEFDFHKYMMRTLEVDFKKVVGISWYLWLFVVMFLLFNVKGWHMYFWLSFLPVVLLLVVGGKLEHVIIRLAQDVGEMKDKGEAARVKPSDEHFWFKRPAIILHLIHFILFQNAFELAFFFWILSTYGFRSCIMEKVGFIVPRLIMGVIVQVLCSYITLPLYVLVTQMGSKFKEGMFGEQTQTKIEDWLSRGKDQASKRDSSVSGARQTDRMEKEAYESIQIIEQDAMCSVVETLQN